MSERNNSKGTALSLLFCRLLEVVDILERNFQARLIRRIRKDMPEAIVLKTDPTYRQGIPDLLILNGNRWAALEVKRSEKARHQPNQDYYVEKMNRMSFARFIHPDNEREVVHELRQALGAGRNSCVPEPE